MSVILKYKASFPQATIILATLGAMVCTKSRIGSGMFLHALGLACQDLFFASLSEISECGTCFRGIGQKI